MINWDLLQRLIESKLEVRGQSARTLARELGISASTLTRIKQGKSIQVETFCALLNWLEITHKFIMKRQL